MLTVEFTVLGIPAWPQRRPGVQAQRGVFLPDRDRDQEETDRYWNAIVGNGGQESAVRLVQGRWGLSGRSLRACSRSAHDPVRPQ